MKKIAIDDFLKSMAPVFRDNAKRNPEWCQEQINHIQDERLKSALASYLKGA